MRKKQLVKDVTFLLPLIEVMKIVRLKFLLPNLSRLSSPRLRHGRRLALFSHLNFVHSVICSVAGCSSSSSLLISPGILFQSIGFGLQRLPEIPLFCLSAKGLV